MANNYSPFWEYFLKYTLPPLVIIIPAVWWFTTLITKMDANVQIVVNTLNDPIIPILETISKQKIGKIKTVSVDSIQFSKQDTLLVASIKKAVKEKEFERQVLALNPSIYSYLAEANIRKGNAEQAAVAVKSYFEYYAKNKQMKPPSEIHETMVELDRRLTQTASKN